MMIIEMHIILIFSADTDGRLIGMISLITDSLTYYIKKKKIRYDSVLTNSVAHIVFINNCLYDKYIINSK